MGRNIAGSTRFGIYSSGPSSSSISESDGGDGTSLLRFGVKKEVRGPTDREADDSARGISSDGVAVCCESDTSSSSSSSESMRKGSGTSVPAGGLLCLELPVKVVIGGSSSILAVKKSEAHMMPI